MDNEDIQYLRSLKFTYLSYRGRWVNIKAPNFYVYKYVSGAMDGWLGVWEMGGHQYNTGFMDRGQLKLCLLDRMNGLVNGMVKIIDNYIIETSAMNEVINGR